MKYLTKMAMAFMVLMVTVLLPVMKKWAKAGFGIMPREYANIAAVHQVLIQS